MRVYLGHDAGCVSLDLLATLGGRRDERLTNAAALDEWLLLRGLVDEPYGADEHNVDQARRLRTALFGVVEVTLAGGHPDGRDLDVVNAAAAVPERPPVLVLDGDRLCRARRRRRFEEILGSIARDAIELLTGTQGELLRECAADDCRGIYLDTSPGHTRRWCSVARCGNRARVAAHRTRRAAAELAR